MNSNQILISSKDAALLSALLDRASYLPRMDNAVDELATALEAARVVDAAHMPRTVIALGATVDYLEILEDRLRTVTLVHPIQADASLGRISVLSPVGRALLGRRIGNFLEIRLPSGEPRRVKVVGVRAGGDDD